MNEFWTWFINFGSVDLFINCFSVTFHYTLKFVRSYLIAIYILVSEFHLFQEISRLFVSCKWARNSTNLKIKSCFYSEINWKKKVYLLISKGSQYFLGPWWMIRYRRQRSSYMEQITLIVDQKLYSIKDIAQNDIICKKFTLSRTFFIVSQTKSYQQLSSL